MALMGGRAAASVLPLVAAVVLVRFLGQEEYGYYGQLILIASTAAAFFSFGIPQSVYYFVARSGSPSQSLVIRSFAALVVCGLVGGITLVATSARLEQIFDVPLSSYLFWLVAYLALSVPAGLTDILPTADQRAQLQAFMLVTFETLRGLVLMTVVIRTQSLTLILSVLTVYMAVKVLALVPYLFVRDSEGVEKVSPVAIRQQLRYAIPLWGAKLLTLVRDYSHRFFVAATFTTTEFAVYAVGTISPPLVNHINEAIGDVMLIQTAQSYKRGDLGEMRRVWFRAHWPVTACGPLRAHRDDGKPDRHSPADPPLR